MNAEYPIFVDYLINGKDGKKYVFASRICEHKWAYEVDTKGFFVRFMTNDASKMIDFNKENILNIENIRKNLDDLNLGEHILYNLDN